MIKFCARQKPFLSLLKYAAPAVAFSIIGITSAKADVYLYNVSIPTDTLYADSSDAPYTIFVDLTGTGNNTVTLSDFSPTVGTDPITLNDSSGFDSAQENFTPAASPGGTLSFNLSTTNLPSGTSIPDEFSFFILDDNGTNFVPTTDAQASSFFTVDLGGSSPTVTTYSGTQDFTGASPTVNPSTATPEPSPFVSLSVAFLGLGMLIGVRKRARVNN